MEIRDAGLVCDLTARDACSRSIDIRIVPMTYGAILMVLALYKAAEYWRISGGFKGFKLVRILIRDQAIYFIL